MKVSYYKNTLVIIYYVLLLSVIPITITKVSASLVMMENTFLSLLHPTLILFAVGFLIGVYPLLAKLAKRKKVAINKEQLKRAFVLLALLTVLTLVQFFLVHVLIFLIVYFLWFLLGIRFTRAFK